MTCFALPRISVEFQISSVIALTDSVRQVVSGSASCAFNSVGVAGGAPESAVLADFL